ncbi:MAG TPA: hypothetical protein VH256_10155 [Thermoleophilaceae bacterium]|nr:hypothetical protein [Thermoleophilaceae bacterium]
MRAFSIFALSALLLVAAPAAQAAPPRERFVASGAVEVQPGERVSNIAVANGPVTMRGRTTGDLIALHGQVLIDGPVHGDVLVLSKNGVHFGPRARIGGDLTYRGTLPPRAGAIVGGKTHKVNLSKAGDAFGFVTAAAVWLAGTISTLLFGLLLLWLAPRAADAAFEVARSAVGSSIGWGIGLFIGLPLLGVIALITLVGIPLGVGLLLALFPIYALGYTTSAWLLGRRLVKLPHGRPLAFLAGWGILRVAAIVPVLGELVWIAATVYGLGVLLMAVWRSRTQPVAAQPAS